MNIICILFGHKEGKVFTKSRPFLVVYKRCKTTLVVKNNDDN